MATPVPAAGRGRTTRRLPPLAGATAVVTGAASGIGRALALDLAGRGCRLAISDVHDEGLAATAAAARERGAPDVLDEVVDVRDRAAVEAHADAVDERLGDVHLVVNNAGVALHASALEQSREDLEWVMDVDFWGVVNGTEAFLPRLLAAGGGRLVNVSSLFGLVAMPGQSAYNAAKFAVRGYTESVAMEMRARGLPVAVTCVHPGGVRTGIVRAARCGPGIDAGVLATTFDRRLARIGPERAAQVILRGAEAGRARVVVGLDAMALHGLQRLLGAGYQRLVTTFAPRLVPEIAMTPTTSTTPTTPTTLATTPSASRDQAPPRAAPSLPREAGR